MKNLVVVAGRIVKGVLLSKYPEDSETVENDNKIMDEFLGK